MVKKITFILILIMLWNLTLLFFPIDIGFLSTLKLIVPYNKYYLIFWLMNTIFVSYSFYKIMMEYDLNNNYLFVLILNYLFTQIFGLLFFYFNSLILGIISLVIICTTSIFCFIETNKIDNIYAKLWIYPIIFNLFNLISIIFSYLHY